MFEDSGIFSGVNLSFLLGLEDYERQEIWGDTWAHYASLVTTIEAMDGTGFYNPAPYIVPMIINPMGTGFSYDVPMEEPIVIIGRRGGFNPDIGDQFVDILNSNDWSFDQVQARRTPGGGQAPGWQPDVNPLQSLSDAAADAFLDQLLGLARDAGDRESVAPDLTRADISYVPLFVTREIPTPSMLGLAGPTGPGSMTTIEQVGQFWYQGTSLGQTPTFYFDTNGNGVPDLPVRMAPGGSPTGWAANTDAHLNNTFETPFTMPWPRG